MCEIGRNPTWWKGCVEPDLGTSQQHSNLHQSQLPCQPKPEERQLSGAECQTFCADSLLHEEKHPWPPLLKCKTGKPDRRNFIEEKQVGETLLQLGGQNQGEQPFITSIAYAFHHDARKWPLTYLVLKKKKKSITPVWSWEEHQTNYHRGEPCERFDEFSAKLSRSPMTNLRHGLRQEEVEEVW